MVTHSHFYRFTTLQCLSCFRDYHLFWFYTISNEHYYVSIKQMGYGKFRLMAWQEGRPQAEPGRGWYARHRRVSPSKDTYFNGKSFNRLPHQSYNAATKKTTKTQQALFYSFHGIKFTLVSIFIKLIWEISLYLSHMTKSYPVKISSAELLSLFKCKMPRLSAKGRRLFKTVC